jgi:beta-galactosidase
MEGQHMDVRCYSNLDHVELFLNGKSLGSKSVVRNSHLQWTVKYEPGTIKAHGFKNGKVVLADRRETTGAPEQLVLRPSLSKISADGEDVSAIAVEVQDAQGRVMPRASNKLRFELTGAGKIIGVGNGDPSCREADKPDSSDLAERSAFNGLCMVFIQSTRQAGSIQLQVSASGLQSTKVEIQSIAAAIRPFAN